MVCLGLEPRAAGWKAQTNPLSYGGTPQTIVVSEKVFIKSSFLSIVTIKHLSANLFFTSTWSSLEILTLKCSS